MKAVARSRMRPSMPPSGAGYIKWEYDWDKDEWRAAREYDA